VVKLQRAACVAGLLAAAALLLIVAGSLVMANPFANAQTCIIPQPAVTAPLPAIYLLAAGGAFGLGRLLGFWRTHWKEPVEELSRADAGAAVRRDRRRAVAVQVVLAVCLTLVTGLLAYETWAELDGSNRAAITDFVRCASGAAFPQTIMASTVLLFLAGHWLWHPVRG
jgi:hypothetical protein